MLSEEKPLIRVHGLSKSYEIYPKSADRIKQSLWGNNKRRYYRDFHALSHVSFEVYRGASFAVIGKNGAGKSTLLQLITGTLEPTAGTIEVNGKVAAVLELGAGFNMEYSGRENIELYCNLLMMPPSAIKARFDQIVAFSELEDFIDQPLKTYSSGMVARLAFSVIAHVDADILIIDEALSVGDASFSQKCMRFLHEFVKHGSIFFVSHDLSAVKRFCDSAMWLEHGKVRAFGESAKVCDAYMADIYPNETQSDVTGSKPVLTALEPEMRVVKPTHASNSEAVDKGAQHLAGFNFNPNSAAFGNGGAEIIGVGLTGIEGRALSHCEGQTLVQVSVKARAIQTVDRPILGFFIKDRLGQALFGANTYRAYEGQTPSIAAGQTVEAVFSFKMPTLMIGDYSVCAAIADGTLQSHTQLHWLHDAGLFKVTTSSLDGVLVGIPMQGIELRCIQPVLP